jgi:hypothetical protein
VIGNEAFEGCKSLQSIAIPDSVTTIGPSALCHCTNLESVLFTDQSRLQEIGRGAFSICTSLQSIIIPKSVFEIRGYVFAHCSKLTHQHPNNSHINKWICFLRVPCFAGY